MTGNQMVLRNHDDAFNHPWDSVMSVLKGVTDEEASWQAPCYAGEPPEEGMPPAGTIRWQLVHLAQCKRHYSQCLIKRPSRPPESPLRPAGPNLADDIEELTAAHRELGTHIAAITDAQMDETIDKRLLIERVASFIRHDSWHAGQIAVVRRMWKARG